MGATHVMPSARSANAFPFATALDAVKRADTMLESTSGRAAARHYRQAVERLVFTPAPNIAALAEKIAAADPFDLDHHAAILADARRLAGTN